MMIPYFALISILFDLSLVGGQNSHKIASGSTFTDIFQRFDESLWYKDEDHLHCIAWDNGSADATRCVYRKESNVEIAHHTGTSRPFSELQITMKSDCQGPQCCINGRCTRFSSGLIMSRETYSFGSFRFIARPDFYSGFLESKLFDAVSCFGLEDGNRNDDGQILHGHLSVTMCVRAKDPKTILVMCAKSAHVQRHFAHVDEDLLTRSMIYRIDWKPKSLSYFLNGEKLFTLTAPENYIPQENLRIKIFVFPRITKTLTSDMNIDAEDLEMKLKVLRVHYRPLEVKKQVQDKTELLVHNDSSSFPLMTVSFCFISCLLYFFTMRIIAHFTDSSLPPDYLNSLLSDSLIINECPAK